MRILSATKDYYDYVAHLYGGGDPKIIYNRKSLGEPVEGLGNSTYRSPVEVSINDKLNFQHEAPYGTPPVITGYDIKHLIVAGCPFTVYRKIIATEQWGDWKTLHPDDEVTIPQRKSYWYMHGRDLIRDGVQNKVLVEISQKLGHPVFIITGMRYGGRFSKNTVVIEGNVPNLGELGFASIKSAEQTYQDISYFVGNTMLVPTPDNMPIIKQTDKEKILAHGLDFKASFRHRK